MQRSSRSRSRRWFGIDWIAEIISRGCRGGRNTRRFLIQACLNTVLPFTLVAWGEQHVNAGLAGICLVVGPAALAGFGTALTAQLAIVLAAVAYGAAVTFGRTFRDLDPMMPAAGSLIWGAAILIPVSLVVDRPWTLAPSQESMLALLALSVFSTARAFVIYFTLLKRLGSVGTTAQAYLRVPIGGGIGIVFLGEAPQPSAWLGLVFVVVSVIAKTLPARRRLHAA